MKNVFLLFICLAFTYKGVAQTSFSIEYDITIDVSSEDVGMMAMLFEGSSMVVAVDGFQSYVKTIMGSVYTIEVETNQMTKNATVLMTSIIENMAFQGNSDEFQQDVPSDVSQFEFLRGRKNKKRILGYKCKKAVSTDENGGISVYWYTKKIKRPNVDVMPNTLPGACLVIEIRSDEMVIAYTAVKVKKKVDMNDYRVRIPDGLEVRPLSEMGEIGQ